MKNSKIYFKHTIIHSGKQDDVEREINVYNDADCEVVSVNVTPERVGVFAADGYSFPKYIYHLCIAYQERHSTEIN